MSSAHQADPPHRVPYPVMRQRWETLTFFHWAYPVDVVQQLLPPPLQVEPWDGRAWVGLIPLHMRVRPPVGPALPGLSTFPETNVRTYVVGPNGRPGLWFFSLDAANPVAVAAARLAYGLPYYRAAMEVTRPADAVTYRSTRRRGDPGDVSHRIEVVPGPAMVEDDLGELDHFLTARFRLWSINRRVVIMSNAEHARWPLRHAEVKVLEQNLIEAAGLPTPVGDPIVHYSDGVDVRIGPPRPQGSVRSSS